VVFLPQSAPPVSLGDRIFLAWSVTAIEQHDPGFQSFVRSQGAGGSALAFHVDVVEEASGWTSALTGFRRSVAAALREALPGDPGALASGIVTGDDARLSKQADQAFERTGTSHITAVSGQNVALLLGVLGTVLRPSGKVARIVTTLAMLATVWGFVIMVGLEAPALRAATVATLALGASYVGRRPDPLTLLSLTLGGMALWNPAGASGVGFWLSAAASFALCSAVTIRGRGIRSLSLAVCRGVVAANIATLPILVWAFGEWSPSSMLANVIIGPVMTVTFPLTYGLALLALVSPPLAAVVAWAPAIGLDLTLSVVGRLAPLVGGITLPSTDPRIAILVGAPAMVVVLMMGRDLSRWASLIRQEWNAGSGHLRSLASGAVAGAVALCLLIVIVP
jgi:competence protein ComEC